jgi:hypothetical protein
VLAAIGPTPFQAHCFPVNNVTIDAFKFCLRTILWQEYEPKLESVVYYASKQMSLAERKYSTTEGKALGVTYTYKKYRH